MKKKMLIAGTIYGERYIDTFFNYGFPSLLTPGNLPALQEKIDCGILIHTDKAGAERFKSIGLPTIVDVMEGDKYEQIGRHQNQDLLVAKGMGADYHLLMPDFIYSEDCFTGVLNCIEQGHKAITRLVVSTEQESIAPWLRPGLTARELSTLSLLYMHPGIKNWMAVKDKYPATHVMAWRGHDTLTMCSPHQTPVYIANEAIKASYATLPLDCILDQVIDGPIYCPKPEDEIVIIEVSPKDGRKPNDNYVDLKEFCRCFKWDTKNSKQQFEIFNEETVDAINPAMFKDEPWNEVDIFAQKRKVLEAIRENM